jgi:hypothetical protein
MEPFETRLAGRIRVYTDRATERRIDTLAIARTAMSSQRATGWPQGRLPAGVLRRSFADPRWAVAFMAVVLVGVVGVAVLGRLSHSSVGPQPTPTNSSTPGPTASAGGPIPDGLRHQWQRPAAVFLGLDKWGSGFLSLGSGSIGFGPEPGAGASSSAITVAGPDTLTVTATVDTRGCAVGAVGTYRWSLDGKGTVLILTAIGPDACSEREAALAGDWVRADLTPAGPDGPALEPGTHATAAFDPFARPGVSGQLSYTVPVGWNVTEDGSATFVLHHIADAPQGGLPVDAFVAVLTQPRMAAEADAGVACGPVGAAPGVGGGIDELVAAIWARPGVVSTPPTAVTIGGFEGQILDLRLAPSWTGGCRAPEGPIVGVSILVQAGSEPGPVVGIGPDHPVRLILLDLADGRTVAVSIFSPDASPPSSFEAQVADVMPIIESFEFHPPAP